MGPFFSFCVAVLVDIHIWSIIFLAGDIKKRKESLLLYRQQVSATSFSREMYVVFFPDLP
jgi:hypothetical protein